MSSFFSFQLSLAPMCLFTIGIEDPFDVTRLHNPDASPQGDHPTESAASQGRRR